MKPWKDFCKTIHRHGKTVALASVDNAGYRFQAEMWHIVGDVNIHFSTGWILSPTVAVAKLSGVKSVRMAMRPHGDKLIAAMERHCEKYGEKK